MAASSSRNTPSTTVRHGPRRGAPAASEMATEDARSRGLEPGEAVRAAQVKIGAASQAMDALRDQRGLPWLDDLGAT